MGSYATEEGLLIEAGFDAFVEDICKPYYAAKMGAPSLPPGRYFRMHMVGYFEGIDSERGVARTPSRCATSCGFRLAKRFLIIRGALAVLGLAAGAAGGPRPLRRPLARAAARRPVGDFTAAGKAQAAADWLIAAAARQAA